FAMATDSTRARACLPRWRTTLPREAGMHSLHAFFEPRAVALIGASADEDKLSGRPLRFMKEAGFGGRIHPINTKASHIQDLPAHATLEDVDDDIDHAIIVLPAPAVEEALLACARKGIKAVQIFTAGFAELGP